MNDVNLMFTAGVSMIGAGVLCIILTGIVPKPRRSGFGAAAGILIAIGITFAFFALIMYQHMPRFNGYAY